MSSSQVRRLAMLDGPDSWWKPPMVQAIVYRDRFDVARLRETLRLLARRHRSLRTYFLRGNCVDEAACLGEKEAQWPLRFVLASSSEESIEDETRAFAWLQRDFDPFEPPLLRALLLRRSQDDFLGLSIDHTIFDGYSLRILLADLAFVYDSLGAGPTALVDELATDSAQFAHDERRWLQSDSARAAYRYWDRQHSGLGAFPLLPLQYDEASAGTDSPSVFYSVRWTTEEVDLIARRLSELRITEFMLVAAAVAITIRDHASTDQVALLFSNSRRSWRSARDVVGYLSNRSLLRIDVSSSENVASIAPYIRTSTLEAVRHGMMSHDHFMRVRFPDVYATKPTIPHLLLNVLRQSPVPSIARSPCVRVSAPPRADALDPPGLRLILGFHADGTATFMSEFPRGLYRKNLIEELTRTVAQRCLEPFGCRSVNSNSKVATSRYS